MFSLGAALARVLPGGDVGEMLVVAQRLAVRGLMLLPEMSAARLLAMQRIEAHQLAELEEVGDASRLLERLIELGIAARDVDVAPELLAQLAESGRAPPESLRSRAIPHFSHMILPSSRWNDVDGALPVDAAEKRSRERRPPRPRPRGIPDATYRPVSSLFDAEIVADRVRHDEVAVGEPLHQRARAEPVRAVIGEVRFADHVQPGIVLIRL